MNFAKNNKNHEITEIDHFKVSTPIYLTMKPVVTNALYINVITRYTIAFVLLFLAILYCMGGECLSSLRRIYPNAKLFNKQTYRQELERTFIVNQQVGEWMLKGTTKLFGLI